MYNKDLFDKICKVTCSFSELEGFVTGIDKKEFDLENPFEKYYGVDKIIAAIELYQSKRIEARFLSYWMNAYNWIITGGFKQDNEGKSQLKQFMIWEIADWLDSLSFFDDSDDFYNLEDYKTTFITLDKVLNDVDNCEVTVAKNVDNVDDCDGNDEEIVFIVNDKGKYFIKFYEQLDYIEEDLDFPQVAPNELKAQEKALIKAGYEKLNYGFGEGYDD